MKKPALILYLFIITLILVLPEGCGTVAVGGDSY